MKDLLYNIVAPIVTSVDDIKIDEKVSPSGERTLYLSVAQSDMGKVIGKRGKVAKALRSLLKAYAIKNEIRVNLEIVEALEA